MTIGGTLRIVLLLLGLAVAPCAGAAAPAPRIDGLDARIEALMHQAHVPGAAVAVLRDGVPVHIGAYGLADLSHRVEVTPRTVFELASLSKQMTALAVLTLVEQGRLSLKARLVEWIADAPAAWADITIDQLLAHRAGLAHHFERSVDGVLLIEYDRAQMLASAKAAPMVAAPGTDWHYSDQGYFLLGLVVEAVTGRTFAQHMQETFFAPLGMAQTHLLDQRRIVPHLAQGYAWTGGALQRNRRVWQFDLTPHFGVMSSLEDLLRWEAALANPRVLNRRAIEATWALQRRFDTGRSCDDWGYARGWWMVVAGGRRIVHHAGYAGTAYVRAIDHRLSVIVLTNREDTPNAPSPMAIAWAAAHAAEPALPLRGYRCWE